MNDHDFGVYFQAVRDDIRQMREEINERLDRLNGSVREHDTKIALLEAVSHPQNSCPIVHEVIKDVNELKAQAEANTRLVRIAIAVGAGFVAIAQAVIEWFRH